MVYGPIFVIGVTANELLLLRNANRRQEARSQEEDGAGPAPPVRAALRAAWSRKEIRTGAPRLPGAGAAIQIVNRAATWKARGPPEPNTWPTREVG